MISISLCMIVRDEEELLKQCLASVSMICDEIIIVDTGSTDRTEEIAREFTDDIYHFKWIDDFAAARNFAFSKATKDYIFWLDADDVLLAKDQKKLKELKMNLSPTIDSVSMDYILDFDNFNNPSFYFKRNRLVKRVNHFKWIGFVHEYLEVGGTIFASDIAVVHRKDDKKGGTRATDRNLKIYEGKLKNGEVFSPRDLFYYGNELKDHQKYEKALIYYEKFLATKLGWIEDEIRACLSMAECYVTLDKQKERLDVLLRILALDRPRPEACCRLGDYFNDQGNSEAAIYWYETAIKNEEIESLGFQNKAFTTWYPHLSLCACYWKIGEVEKSIKHHKQVAKWRPNDPRVLFNSRFFQEYSMKK